jgi:hypothetical protein
MTGGHCFISFSTANTTETFRVARKATSAAGVVKRVLRVFDELAKCDQEGVLAEVRMAVELTNL